MDLEHNERMLRLLDGLIYRLSGEIATVTARRDQASDGEREKLAAELHELELRLQAAVEAREAVGRLPMPDPT